MRAYLIRRLIFAVVLVFLSTVLSFAILKASPGSTGGQQFMDPRLSREYIDAQKRLFGLDRSPVRQYLDWLGVTFLFDRTQRPGLIEGDLGLSIMYKQPVARVIRPRLWATLALNLVTLVFTWSIAIPLGIWAAVKHYKWPDK